MRRTYWRFYWPLAVTGITIVLANQFQNGVLARYPDSIAELAIFAYAFSTFTVFRAALVFVPQMVNLLARSRHAHRVLIGFMAFSALGLSLPLLVVGYTSAGSSLLGRIFDIDGETLTAVVIYLRRLAPLVLVHAFRQHLQGLLIQMQSTRLVTVLNLVYLSVVFGMLVLGFVNEWAAATTLVTALWTSALVHLALVGLSVAVSYELPALGHADLSYRAALGFFWPVAVTSMMFALSRPILYAYVSHGPDASLALVQVASLRVGFDFAAFFHQPLNQLRNLFATYGTSDLAGLRRFQIEIVAGLSLAMVLVSWSSLDSWIFTRFLGVEGEVLRFASQAFAILCGLPVVVGFRNYFHGIALARLSTEGMALGAVLRAVVILLLAEVVSRSGLLDHRAAAAILVVGFAAEAVVVLLALRWTDPGERSVARGR